MPALRTYSKMAQCLMGDTVVDAKATLKVVRGPEWLVDSVWARCPQRRGFDPPLGKFFGDFSLGVSMGSNSIPPKNSFG